MEHNLTVYNSLSREKEIFIPINPPFVGLYVCGPTVYGEPHLGHIRMAITYDILFRYLKYLGYKVRYVRNITDVGHLEDEGLGEGEDRIAKKALLEKLEPMEVVQKYKNIFQHTLELLNTLPPSIEPLASGHIIEQQIMIRQILENGFAYESNGSVYFDISAYEKKYSYGILSGRNLNELQINTRNLEGQSEKRNPFDFALWKKANPEHLMHWPSEWSEGFPGWHLECSAMSTKYLGNTFDIHGGGMDLIFPHHECEIAQSVASHGKSHVKYWFHNNMVTIEGKKMAKSHNNFITLHEIFTGTHEKLSQAYSPMSVKFFVLQAQYRSTLDFSDEALQASQKGFLRLSSAIKLLNSIKAGIKTSIDFGSYFNKCFDALNDDLNTPVVLAQLFELCRIINLLAEGVESISEKDLKIFRDTISSIYYDILGLQLEDTTEAQTGVEEKLIELILDLRIKFRDQKDFNSSDAIRDKLAKMGISIKDTKQGPSWKYE